MDTISVPLLASELGVSLPRVHRCIDRLGLAPGRHAGSHVRLSRAGASEVERVLGRARSLPALSRDETLVLAALGRSPFGLVSARSVGRAAGVSPTTAGRALQQLIVSGYVEQKVRRVVEGKVKDLSAYEVRWSTPQWRAAAGALGSVTLPDRTAQRVPPTLPQRFSHLFWDAPHPNRIALEDRGVGIAHRILTGDDASALSWMVRVIPKKTLRRAAGIRGTDARTKALAENLAR